MFVLVHLGCYNKNILNEVAYKQQKFIFHSSEGWKSKVGVPAWSRSGKNPLLGCRLHTSHCILMWWRAERESKLPCDCYKGTNLIHGSSTLMTLFKPNCLPRPYFLILSHWTAGFQHMTFRGTHSICNSVVEVFKKDAIRYNEQ